MSTNWNTPVDAQSYFRQQEKRLQRAERMSQQPVTDLLGPGMAAQAVQIIDWNTVDALLNGFYYSQPGAQNSPDQSLSWTGHVIAKDDGSGMQQVWNTDGPETLYWMRTYSPVGDGTVIFTDWKRFASASGYVDDTVLHPQVVADIQKALNDSATAMNYTEASNSTFRQPDAPVSSSQYELRTGDTWFDTDDNNHIYVYDAAANAGAGEWVDASDLRVAQALADSAQAKQDAQNAANDAANALNFAETKNTTYRQTDKPTGGTYTLGDVWFDTDDGNHIYVYDGTDFVDARDTTIASAQAAAAQAQTDANNAATTAANAQTAANNAASTASQAQTAAQTAQTAANNAQTTATAKNTVYRQDNMPTGGTYKVGDTWFDTNDGFRVYVYDGTTFADAQDTDIAAAQSTASSAQTAANSASTAAANAQSTANTANTTANNAMTAANGKNKITWSPNAAPASASGTTAGDTWFQRDGTGTIIAQWESDGTNWVSRIVGSQVIANLDAGKITTGLLAAARVQIGSGTTFASNYDPTTKETPTGAQNKATTAQTNAQTYADNTYGPTKTTVTGWTYSGTTNIDGGDIQTDTVTAVQIAANAITAKHTLTGPTIQTVATANSGIKITSAGLSAYNGSGVRTFFADASTGSVTLTGSLATGSFIDGSTVTGGTVQTENTASRGIKINSSGLTGYDSSGNAVFTLTTAGVLNLTGTLNSGTVNGGYVTGATIQTTSTAARGVKIGTSGLTAYDGSGNAVTTIDATTGVITATGGLMTGGKVTGAVVQTTATASRGVKIDSTGLYAYSDGTANGVAAGANTVSINGTTGAITVIGNLNAGSAVTGATVTGGTLQSESTASRGVKINSSGMTFYTTSGSAALSFVSSTGALTVTGPVVSGGSITSATFLTTSTASRGVKIDSTGLYAYSNGTLSGGPAAGATTFFVDGTSGNVTLWGNLTAGSAINSATMTGGTLQTESTVNRGIKINSAGFTAYDTSGNATVTIDTSGNAQFKGTVTSGSTVSGATISGGTVYGATFSTATSATSTGERVVIRNDGSGGIVEFFGGFSGETPGVIDPTASSATYPSLYLSSGGTGTLTSKPFIRLISGDSPSGGTIQINTIGGGGTVSVTGYMNVSNTADFYSTVKATQYLAHTPSTEVVIGDTYGVSTNGLLTATGGIKSNMSLDMSGQNINNVNKILTDIIDGYSSSTLSIQNNVLVNGYYRAAANQNPEFRMYDTDNTTILGRLLLGGGANITAKWRMFSDTGSALVFLPSGCYIGVATANKAWNNVVAGDTTGFIANTVKGFSAYTNGSDRKLKKNIEDVDGDTALKIIKGARIRSYELKETPKGEEPRTEYGVIAQEIEKVLPSAVTRIGAAKAMSYQDLWALHLRTTQDLIARVEELEARLN